MLGRKRSRSARTARIEMADAAELAWASSSRSARTARIEMIITGPCLLISVVAVRKDRED